MKRAIFNYCPSLFLCLFCVFPVCFSQGSNWHHLTTLPASNNAFSFNQMDGNLYIIRGENFEPNWHTLDDVWIYDIAADSLSSGARMPAPRSLPSGTLVNGKIYAIGGHITPKQTATRVVEVYDIEQNSWDTCASIPTSRVWHSTCVLDGKIYVLGGAPIYQPFETIPGNTLVERYDPESDTWDTCAPLPTGRFGLSACMVDGKIYAIGGYSNGLILSDVEVYDPTLDQWSTAQPMNYPRGEMGLTVRKGKIHAICGATRIGLHNWKVYRDFEVYDPESDSWTLNPDLIPKESLGLAAINVNDRIYVASGVSGPPHRGVRELYMYDYPIATIESKSCVAPNDSLHVMIHEDCRLYIVPDGIPADPDSIAKYQIASWETVENQEIYLPLGNIPIGSYLIYAVALDERIGYDVPQFTIVQYVPEFVVQVVDDYTMEKLASCSIYLNGKRFEKESEEALSLTGWAYDTCTLQITKSDYFDFDTTVVVKTDTSFVFSLDYFPPEAELEINIESFLEKADHSVIEKADYLIMKMTQNGMIYITPEHTPAIANSIIDYAIKSYTTYVGQPVLTSVENLTPGMYRIYGISSNGRITVNSYVVQVIDHFPECIIQVQDAKWQEPIDSCVLVIDGIDTIVPTSLGEFDLTGLVYDSTSIEVTWKDSLLLDTTFVVLTDTYHMIYMITGIEESTIHDVRIYPNPTHDLITVQTREYGIYSLEVINLSGQVMKKMDFHESSFQVDLSLFKSGIYLIRIVSSDKITMGRVIKY